MSSVLSTQPEIVLISIDAPIKTAACILFSNPSNVVDSFSVSLKHVNLTSVIFQLKMICTLDFLIVKISDSLYNIVLKVLR